MYVRSSNELADVCLEPYSIPILQEWTLVLSSLRELRLDRNSIGPSLAAITLMFTQNGIVVNLTSNSVERITYE